MGMFWELAGSFADGFIKGVVHGQTTRHPAEPLCGQLGWSVDERDGNVIRLHFRDPVCGVRKVIVRADDASRVQFVVASAASMRTVPNPVSEYLLTRNMELPFGGWSLTRNGDGDALFALIFLCLSADGLTAPQFKAICETLTGEARDFDAKMKGSGLLS